MLYSSRACVLQRSTPFAQHVDDVKGFQVDFELFAVLQRCKIQNLAASELHQLCRRLHRVGKGLLFAREPTLHQLLEPQRKRIQGRAQIVSDLADIRAV